MKPREFLMLLVIAVFMTIIIASCAAPLSDTAPSNIPNTNATLLAKQGYLEVWKVSDTDSYGTTVCYLSVNTNDVSAPIGIWCK
jgi:hypothetical protein